MGEPFRVWKDVYQVGGADISHPYDCSVYLVDAGDLILIDSGAGKSFDHLVANIKSLGFDPGRLKAVLVTHAHIDHIGSLYRFRETYGARVVAHEMDTGNIEKGEGVGADSYGITYRSCTVDIKLKGDKASLKFGACEFKVIHIPGHTPGSIAIYADMDNKRVLFGQDIHGPYQPEWGADPQKAKESLQKLIDLKADILCEGHFGVYEPASAVERYIRRYLRDSLGTL